MANHQATGKKAKHGENLIQRSRAAVLNALDVVEKRGTTISEILADEFIANPIKFMELASKLSPKEIHADVEHRESVDPIFQRPVLRAIGYIGEEAGEREDKPVQRSIAH